MKNFLLYILLNGLVVLSSCNGGQNSLPEPTMGTKEPILFAKGFEIVNFDNYTVLSVADPWDSTKTLQSYVIVDREKPLPDNLPNGTVIKVPVKNAIMYTTVHVAVFEYLNALSSIAGICESEYLTSPKSKELVANGTIADCGLAASPNIEKIMDVEGEIIIVSPFEHGGYGQAEKLGIPIFEAADYMETHPLGRAEWIKIHGLLTGKKELADSIFRAKVEKYNYYKSLTEGVEYRPKLIAERKYGSSWFIPGGASYVAQMYKDAGADYIFECDRNTGSVPYSFETVLDKGENADIWLLKYDMKRAMTYSDLKAEYKPYEMFKPFREKKIYTCNTTHTPYCECISIHPDIILADLVHIFHPELIEDYTPMCFMPMAE
jgi:iron complex transport system substrate-binding protein